MKIFLLVAALAVASPAYAFTPPTDTEKDACRHDALTLCTSADILSAWFGNNAGMVACFKANKPKLSAKCRAALRARGL